jgi:hypothetical protein
MSATTAPNDARALERAVSWAVGVVALTVYALTLYRTVPGGDSGELIGAVASGGVIHPPGYPLYALLGSAFIHFPVGSLAFRLNLLSAVCDALAAALLARAVARSSGSSAGGLVAGTLFAFSPGAWRYAIAAEVFALNNLAIATLLWLAVLYAEAHERRYALAGAFVLGLGLANHQTVLFTGIPVVVWAVRVGRDDLLRRPVMTRLVLVGAAGLLPYLYLPIAASHQAFVTWGAANTWSGFWTHVLRREYGTFSLAPVGVGAAVRAEDVWGAWWHYAWDQMGVWALALAAVGVDAALRYGSRGRQYLGLLVLVPPILSVGVMMALGNLPIATDLFREILARFWQQPDLYVAALAGIGFAATVAGLTRLPNLAAAHVPVLAWALAAAIGVVQLATHYRALDRHANHLVEDYAAEMLRVAPPGGIILSKGDLITNGLRYLQLAQHARPDVRVVDQELLATSWGRPLFERHAPGVVFPGDRLALDPSLGFSLKALLDANHGEPIMVCGGLTPGDHSTDAAYGLWPVGLCDDVRSGTEPVSLDEWLARANASVPHIDFAGQAHPLGSWENVVWSDYWEVRQQEGAHILTVAGSNLARRKYIAAAVDIFQRVVDENPNVPPHVHKNLAIAIGRAGITTAEQKAQAKRAWEGYLRVAPRDDPQLPAIRKELERLGE